MKSTPYSSGEALANTYQMRKQKKARKLPNPRGDWLLGRTGLEGLLEYPLVKKQFQSW